MIFTVSPPVATLNIFVLFIVMVMVMVMFMVMLMFSVMVTVIQYS